MSRSMLQIVVLLLLATASLVASAQTRAWLDRDRIEFGETVTLNIETDNGATPEYQPLEAEFGISGHSSSRRVELTNGRMRSTTLYAIALTPRRDGVVTIPPLRVGNELTAPLSLVVAPATARVPTRAGDDVFLESEVDDATPYVQQAVGLVVRLYSAVPLVSGELDQPAPEGATLRQVGEDAQYSREIQGRRYTVIERRYLMIPERSGALQVPAATFEGRGATGFFDDFLGRSGALRARAAPRSVNVLPIPASAPQPWLPLHDLTLSYRSTPQELRVGSAATLVIEAVADGASAAQMPELQLPPIDGVQVFAEPVQADERFRDGRPEVTLTRKFSLVPTAGGRIELTGLALDWWDVRSGKARTTRLAPLQWQVTGAPAASAAGNVPAPSTPTETTAPGSVPTTVLIGTNRGWVLATLAFAALWLATLFWGLHRKPASDSAGTPATRIAPAVGKADATVLKRALASGDFGDVADSLCAMARPPARDIDEVRRRLDDPAQCAAIDAMQQARWGEGDGTAARMLLREAFARAPRWRQVPTAANPPLPPLYPSA